MQIVGFGFIGQSFAEMLIKKRSYIKDKYGLDIKIVSISDISGTIYGDIDLIKALKTMKEKGRIIEYPSESEVKKKEYLGIEAIENIDADLILELTPSNIKNGEPGLSHMLTAFRNSKHVVTSNKGPLAIAFKMLSEEAKKNGVEFRFEASVGGAMPIINFARETLAGTKIMSVQGIFNGTTNYILTKMTKDNVPLDIVLKEAQEMGIAESDPSYDIDGIDTASKLVIIANAVMNIDATIKDVKIEGIRKITPELISIAKEEGYVVKLIGEVCNNKLEVSPRLVPESHPLNVGGTLNVAVFYTDIAGEVTVIGKGAGKETVSALLSDIISIYRCKM